MRVGSASAERGETATGYLDATDLPTGTAERLPVVLARGAADGPTLWITAAIHGDEVTGLATAQDAMAESLVDRLRGTVVCLPLLNPAGLRRTARTSYYHGDDPNRYFPDPETEAERHRPPRVQELVDRRVFEAFAGESPDEGGGDGSGDPASDDAAADALIDLHTAQVGSEPFLIRDRVLFRESEAQRASEDASGQRPRAERTEEEAEALAHDLEQLVDAFGLPVVNEYAADEYTGENLQRSTAGAALNNAGIPAFTVEIGGHGVVDEPMRRAGVAGCYRVMVELGMLEEYPEFGPDVEPRAPPVDYPVKRAVHPYTGTAGIARHRVEAGDVVAEGDVVADVVSPHGEVLDSVESEHDGYVLGRWEGVAVYENDPLCSLAVRDDGDLVVPQDSDDGDDEGDGEN